MSVRGDLSVHAYHLRLEESCVCVLPSEAKAITREDHDPRIVTTFDIAMEYLQRAYNLLGFPYKKYFAHLLYKAQVNKFKRTNPFLDIKKYKEELKQRLCEEFSDLSPELAFKDFNQLKSLSLSFIALDKKKGKLFLVLPHQTPSMPITIPNELIAYEQWIYYCTNHPINLGMNIFISVDITKEPSLRDWNIVHDKISDHCFPPIIISPFNANEEQEELLVSIKQFRRNITCNNQTSNFIDPSIVGVSMVDSYAQGIHLTIESIVEKIEFISDTWLEMVNKKSNGCFIISKEDLQNSLIFNDALQTKSAINK